MTQEEYNEKKEARIERYAARAAKARQESDRQYEFSNKLAAASNGQPILIGHHSERATRRHYEKIHNAMDRSCEEQKKAKYWEQRAHSAASNNAISSDDPNAIEQLAAKLATLEHEQEYMKRINKAYRAGKMAEAGLSDEEITRIHQRIEKAYSWEKQPYPGWTLQNNNANIRRIKERIELLQKQSASETTETDCGNGITIIDNVDANRLQIVFPGKPSESIRKELKSYGFRWSPQAGAWQQYRSNQATYRAERIVELAKADESISKEAQ